MNVKYRYPPEVEEYLRKNIPGNTYEDVLRMVKDEFDVDLDLTEMKKWAWNREIVSGVARKSPITDEIGQYILQNYKGIGPTEMAKRINEQFGTSLNRNHIKRFYAVNKLRSGLTGHFGENGKRGNHEFRPSEANIATQFKKGTKPHNTCDVGTTKVKSDGYVWRKIGPGRHDWKQEHILIWEQANGPKPEGMMIIFLDGDKSNLNLDNLKCISKAEHMEMIRSGLRFTEADLTEIGTNIAKLTVTIRNAKRK